MLLKAGKRSSNSEGWVGRVDTWLPSLQVQDYPHSASDHNMIGALRSNESDPLGHVEVQRQLLLAGQRVYLVDLGRVCLQTQIDGSLRFGRIRKPARHVEAVIDATPQIFVTDQNVLRQGVATALLLIEKV